MELFEKKFESMLMSYGNAIEDKKRFRSLIKDYFPDQQKTMNLVLMAYETGIADGIRKTGKINQAFAYQYVKVLTSDYGVSRRNADWAVSVWCVCYGKNTHEKNCEIQIQTSEGPAITEEKPVRKKYGELFSYRASDKGDGLAVCGFSGDSTHTVILQNQYSGRIVIEIGRGLFEEKELEEAIITEGYLYIGERAFRNSCKLHQVIMPYTIVEIGEQAFEGCNSLRLINLTERLERIGKSAFQNTSLKTIVFPASLYYVGENAFAGCESLDRIKIPKSLEKLPGGMFEGCRNLKRVELQESLYEIGDRAFKDCSELDIMTIPDSVEKIGDNAFEGTNKMFIIQCSVGSYAEKYARSHKIKYQLV